MSQTPNPHDPYGTEPGRSVPEQGAYSGAAPAGAQPAAGPFAAEQGAPTSDPALHPHDPYAYDAASGQAPSAPGAPSTSQGDGLPVPDPYSAPAPGQGVGGSANEQQTAYEQPTYAAPAAGTGGYAGAQGGYGAQDQFGQQPPQSGYAQSGIPGPSSLDVPPPGTKGVYEGPLSGQPTTDSDSRMWAMFAQLAVILGHVVSVGFLGWVGPLIIFLVYKDRSRFVRFHAAEALNGAIAVLIAEIVLGIALGIFGIVTLGFGFALFPLAGAPALVQLIFGIIGAIKANKGEYWNYPLNIRLVK